MTLRLSIIIPCYNSALTLDEAVASCFNQNLDPSTFEIIMVDDGSTDTTRADMQRLAATYANSICIFHPENRGGGAARNTGIKASTGKIIYCLDSDNLFAPLSVPTILDYLEINQLDGALFYERRFFSGTNKVKYITHINTKLEADIEITDIFSLKQNILLDNFFYTRIAYDKTAGYPEHHGFDTQCFELRFLAAGNRARVSPLSIFFHRQDVGQNSYFQRVYKQGHFSRNVYLIYEDVLHLFSVKVRRIIMDFAIFQKAKLDTHNLKAKLDQYLNSRPDDFLIPSYHLYLNAGGRTRRKKELATSTLPEDVFAHAVISYQDTELESAQNDYNELLKNGVDSDVIYFNLLRLHLALTKKYPNRSIEDEVQRLVIRLNPKPQTLNRFAGIINKSASKLKLLWSLKT